MGSFSFTAEIKEDRTLQLPEGAPSGLVTVAITAADAALPSGSRLLQALRDLQVELPPQLGQTKQQIDLQLENERALWR